MTVAELLTDESKWTKGTFARTANGNLTLDSSDDACRWCLIGAVRRVYGFRTNDYYRAMTALNNVMQEPWVADWNDSPERTFAEVRDVVLKAGI